MIAKILGALFGTKSDRDVKELRPFAEEVHNFSDQLVNLSNDELRGRTAKLREVIREAVAADEQQIAALKVQVEEEADLNAKESLYAQIDELGKSVDATIEETLKSIAPEAFAIIKETARRFATNQELEVTAQPYDRELSGKMAHISLAGDKAIWKNSWIAAGNSVTWDMIHYDVQLMGGKVLTDGKIAEMATGEGKTLVATLPVFLNALPGKGVHVVTVNDYLAKRDAEWMGPLYQFHGLTVDCIDKHQPNSTERRAAYGADITFGTNNEFGFDYLRDNMARSPEELVQRVHNYAIVDEVDSVLIDDARTPLIISGPTPKGDLHEFNELKPFITKLVNAQRALIQNEFLEAKRLIQAGDEKEGGKLLLRCHRGLPKNKQLIKFLSEGGMKALLQKTENFYMQDQSKEMPQVDKELYFVIDEKHNSIELTDKGIDLLSGDTDPEFFIMPDIGSAVAELEKAEMPQEDKAKQKDQMMRDFGVKSERIHTMNQLLKAYTLFEKDVEYVVMDNKVKIVDEQTGRIMEGRRYSDGLHQAIEAKENVKIEAATQTYATVTLQNYFRMYKKLAGMTGTAETEAGEFWDIYKLDVVVIPTNKPIVREDREDLVYKTKREKYNAIIEEITKLREAGRPVLVGTTSVEISELLSKALSLRKIPHQVLNAKLHQKEADIVANAGIPGTVTIATNMAGRGTDIKLSAEAKAAGGLAIIGTERHDSRRVDRQLRGRSGRQGDPGSSQFFVSLEDNLMRLFGSERIASLMDRMGLKEGEVIQHSMVTKSIERAQKKVEENNFGIRKRLLEYDDVMNSQREVIYKRRRHALFGERLQLDISNMIYDTVEQVVDVYQDAKDYDGFTLELYRILGVEAPFTREDFEKAGKPELTNLLFDAANEHYAARNVRIAQTAFNVIKDVYEQQAQQYQNIVVPFTDGNKVLQVVTNLEKAYQTQCSQLTRDFEKNITLAIMDDAWKEHLRDLDDLRQYVQGAVYEQKDPLLIYKFESFQLFRSMVDRVNREILSFLFRAQLPSEAPGNVRQAPAQRAPQQKLQTSGPGEPEAPTRRAPQGPAIPRNMAPAVSEKKYGRNDQVTIRNVVSGETKSVKYKVAEPLLATNQWVVED